MHEPIAVADHHPQAAAAPVRRIARFPMNERMDRLIDRFSVLGEAIKYFVKGVD
jgi:hypothetical protein